MAYIKTLYERMWRRQLAMLLIASVMLISCNASPPADLMCVGSDDMGNNVNKTSQLSSSNNTNNGWVDSNLDVQQGKKLTIRTEGSVSLCLSNPQVVETLSFTPSAINSAWQDSGITIQSAYKYIFEVTGKYSLWSDISRPQVVANIAATGNASPHYVDSDAWLRKGKGLFAFIGATPSNTWSGSENQDDTDGFFEMFRRDTAASTVPGASTDGSGYAVGSSSRSGKLWFRYRDSGDDIAANSFLNPVWYGDNWSTSEVGNYTVTVKRYGTCYGENGKFMEAKIASSATDVGSAINLNACSVPGTVGNSDASADVCKNGLYSTLSAPSTGRVWLRILDSVANHGDGNYTAYVPPTTTTAASGSNYGSYSVKLTTVKTDDGKFSSLVNAVVDPVRTILLGNKLSVPPKAGLTETMYKGITGNGDFVQGARALMALSIVFFAFSYMAGLSNITHKELMNLIIKMSLVITAISPSSWDFFSTYLFAFFIDGTDTLIYIMSNNINDLVSGANAALLSPTAANTGAAQGSAVFGFLNSTLSIIFSAEANIKLQALFATFPIGILLASVMYIGIFYFLFALFKALLAYLIAIIMTSLLIFLAPIFFCFILFNLTRPIFNRWLKQLVGFALQPILLFIVLAIFNVFIVMSLYSVLSFNACYTCLWTMNLPLSEIIAKVIPGVSNFDTFCVMHGYLPWGIDTYQDTTTKLAKTPAGLIYVLIFIILANVMLQFIEWVVNMANTLTGSDQAQVSASAGATAAIGQATGMIKSAASMGADTAKFAVRNTAAVADKATGGVFSDGAKKVTRKVLPNFLVKGGKDKTGERVAVKTSLMTKAEKKGYERKMAEFDKLSDKEKKSVVSMNKDARDDYRLSRHTKDARKDIKKAQMKDLATLGGGSKSLFASGAAGKRQEAAEKAARGMYDKKAIKKYAKAGRGNDAESVGKRDAIRAGLADKTKEALKASTPEAIKAEQKAKAEEKKAAKTPEGKALAANKKMVEKAKLAEGGKKTGFDRFRKDSTVLAKRDAVKQKALDKELKEEARLTRRIKTDDGRTFTVRNGEVTRVEIPVRDDAATTTSARASEASAANAASAGHSKQAASVPPPVPPKTGVVAAAPGSVARPDVTPAIRQAAPAATSAPSPVPPKTGALASAPGSVVMPVVSGIRTPGTIQRNQGDGIASPSVGEQREDGATVERAGVRQELYAPQPEWGAPAQNPESAPKKDSDKDGGGRSGGGGKSVGDKIAEGIGGFFESLFDW